MFKAVNDRASNFKATSTLYGRSFSDLDPLFSQRRAGIAVLDGFISTYGSGAWLSQQPIEGLESLNTRDRLITILKDGDVVNDFTKAVGVSVAADIGEIPLIPERQVRFNSETNKLELHPFLTPYLDAVNEAIATNYAQPMICPFAVPVGAALVEQTIADYKYALPNAVTESMRANAYIPGVTTASRVLGRALEAKI